MQRAADDVPEDNLDKNSTQRSGRRKRFSFAGYPSNAGQSGKTGSKKTNVLRKKHDRSNNLTGSQQDIVLATAAANDAALVGQNASNKANASNSVAVKAKNLAIVHPLSTQTPRQNDIAKKPSGTSAKVKWDSSIQPVAQQSTKADKDDRRNVIYDGDGKMQPESGAYSLRASHSQPNLALLDRKLNRAGSSKDNRKANMNLSLVEPSKPGITLFDNSTNAQPNPEMFVRPNTSANMFTNPASDSAPFANSDAPMSFGIQKVASSVPGFMPYQGAAAQSSSNGNGHSNNRQVAASAFAPPHDAAYPQQLVQAGRNNHHSQLPTGITQRQLLASSTQTQIIASAPTDGYFADSNSTQNNANWPNNPIAVNQAAQPVPASHHSGSHFIPYDNSAHSNAVAAASYLPKTNNMSNRNSLQMHSNPYHEQSHSNSSSNVSLPQSTQVDAPIATAAAAANAVTFNTPPRRTPTFSGSRVPLSGDNTIVRNNYAALLRRQSQRIVSQQQDAQAMKQRFMATLNEAAAANVTSDSNALGFAQNDSSQSAAPFATARSMSIQSFTNDETETRPVFSSHLQLDSDTVPAPSAVTIAQWRQPRVLAVPRSAPVPDDHQPYDMVPDADTRAPEPSSASAVRIVETRRTHSARRKVQSDQPVVLAIDNSNEWLDQHGHDEMSNDFIAHRPSLPAKFAAPIDHELPATAPVSFETRGQAQPVEILSVRSSRSMPFHEPQHRPLATLHAKSASLDRTMQSLAPPPPPLPPQPSISEPGDASLNMSLIDAMPTKLSLTHPSAITPPSWKSKTFAATPKPYQLNPVLSSANVQQAAPVDLLNHAEQPKPLLVQGDRVNDLAVSGANSSPVASLGDSRVIEAPSIKKPLTNREPRKFQSFEHSLQHQPPPPVKPKPKAAPSSKVHVDYPASGSTANNLFKVQTSPQQPSNTVPKHTDFPQTPNSSLDVQTGPSVNAFDLPPRRNRPSYKETDIDEIKSPLSRSWSQESPKSTIAVAAEMIVVAPVKYDQSTAVPSTAQIVDADVAETAKVTLNDEPPPITVATVSPPRKAVAASGNAKLNVAEVPLKAKVDATKESMIDNATLANTAANSGSFVQPGSFGGPALLASLAMLSGRQLSSEETDYEHAANLFAATAACIPDAYWRSLLSTIAPTYKAGADAKKDIASRFDENEEYYDESEIETGLDRENSGRSPLRAHSTKSASDYLDEVFGASPQQQANAPIGVTNEPFTEHQRSLFNRYNSIRRKLHKAASSSDSSTDQSNAAKSASTADVSGSSMPTVTDPDRWREEMTARIASVAALAKRKAEYLRASETDVELDIRANDELGRQIRAVLVRKCTARSEIDKYDAHVNELDKIIKLLLQLSVRLAKAEQLVRETSEPAQKKAAVEKRNRLRIQYEDAKQLKAAMDKRSVAVHQTLTDLFTPEEYDEYRLYVEMKAKLVVEQQELQDCLHTSDEQLAALRNAQTALSALTAAQIKSLPSSSISQHSS